LYPLLELSEIKVVKNEDLRPVKKQGILKVETNGPQKKNKDVKKIIFDYFITAKSTKTFKDLNSRRDQDENSQTKMSRIATMIEDMSKVNCCYI
jgi:guanylate kinase